MVEVCASIRSTMRASTSGQMVLFSRLAISGTGTWTDSSNVLAAGGLTIAHRPRRRSGTGPPPRVGAPSPTGRSAGRARPAAHRGVPVKAQGARRVWCPRRRAPRRRSRVCTPASVSRAAEVSIRNSDSGVVIRMSGGLAISCPAARPAGVSPERTPTVICRRGQPVLFGDAGDAGQRGAQVAFDVDGQRLERGDVEHPGAGSCSVARCGQPVDGPQERGQRLARSGRRDHQGVLAVGDRRPRPAPAPGWARRRCR